jgi:hypothetical protein
MTIAAEDAGLIAAGLIAAGPALAGTGAGRNGFCPRSALCRDVQTSMILV